MITTIEGNKAIENQTMIFAEFFKFPEKDFFEEIKRGDIDKQIKDLSQFIGCLPTTAFNQQLDTYEQLADQYNLCFLGVKKPFAPPIESIYKQWTMDESYQVPFKHQKGCLMGDSAQHVRHILKALNLEIPDEYVMMPDHLTILLEILAYLVGQGFLQEAKQFKKDHLDWLLDFQLALDRLKKDNHFYSYVLQELRSFLDIVI